MSLSLLTDLYQLTMAYGYWRNGMHKHQSVFHWFYRKNPFNNPYVIACGLAEVVDYLQKFSFNPEELGYLSSLTGNDGAKLFDNGFIDYLSTLRFTGSIHAVEEGTLVFPHEPLLRVEADLIQAQIIETALLNMLNFSSLIATKAARVCKAAAGDKVLEFGLRRAQGVNGALAASRAAYIGGVNATSNVLAGKLYDIPVKGTHAHAWVMSFDTELNSFEAYAEAMPNNCTFLVDTYDTIEGVRNAVKVATDLRAKGYEMQGIRLDSGDLVALSKAARKILDESGFHNADIVASDDLNEDKIAQLKLDGAAISVWGVGTQLVTAYNQPALGGVYKLAAIRPDENAEWAYKIKLSENPIKVSTQGILQVRRFFMTNEAPFADMIFSETIPEVSNEIASFDGRQVVAATREYEDLLKPIFVKGELVYKLPATSAIREKTLAQINLFAATDFSLYPVGLEKQTNAQKLALIQKYR